MRKEIWLNEEDYIAIKDLAYNKNIKLNQVIHYLINYYQVVSSILNKDVKKKVEGEWNGRRIEEICGVGKK